MKEPIKVLHIFAPSLQSRFGGQNVYWKSVFMKWDNPDILHSVLETKTDQMIEAVKAFDFEYYDEQRMTPKWERITWIFSLFKNLVKHQKEYDILHLHVLWWGGLLLGPWAKRKDFPTLYESVLLHEDSPGGIIRQRLGKLKLWCLKKYSAILTISDSLTEDYLKFGFQPSQVHTLMNSVDSEVFRPVGSEPEKKGLRRKYSLPEEARILLFAGSIIQRKGVDVLIDAFISAAREEKDLYLVLVGARNKLENPSLDELFIHHLQEVLDKNGLVGKVKFMGLVQDREQLAEIYRASDVFVFPSRNEGLGNVVLEAMACALPVIVSRLPVLEHVIRDEENGFFVPIDDADALKKEICRVNNDPQLANKIGQAAHTYTVANHGFQDWQLQLSHIYKGLII